MVIRLALYCIFYYIVISHQTSTAGDDHYWAGVVEFSFKDKWNGTDSPRVNTAKNLERYKQLINSPDADPVDIMVFPEYALNEVSTASFVPAVEKRVAPCNNLEYDPIVRDLSCVARDRQKYLVVNLIEKAHCPEENEWRSCATDGLYRFNTNVVFDRHGLVIARYRKHTLYNEPGVNVTSWGDVTQFHTDFGVTFGTFTCFDLLFDQPAMQLIRRGVTDIIYPTMWFSSLPFLTASQIQQAWAYANNVNFLGSGASYPEVGSTGTGVYAGKHGRIVSVMNHNADVKLYVAKVPKINRPATTIARHPVMKYSPSEMANLKLKREKLENYVTSSLPLLSNSNYKETLCHNELCCDFRLNYTVSLPSSNQSYYHYKLAVYKGKRTFSGFADTTIMTCAVLACSGDKLDNCSMRFDDRSTTTVEAVRFNTVDISGVFLRSDDILMLPNSLDTSILPFEVDEFEYSKRLYTEDGANYQEIQYRLVRPRSDLFTFAIWGRKSMSSMPAISDAHNPCTNAAIVIFAVLFTIFNK